jgi:hypothetical protein
MIQNAINSVNTGNVVFASAAYKVSSVLTVTHSYENLIGQNYQTLDNTHGTQLVSTSTSGDMVKFSGGGTGNCNSGGIFYNQMTNFTLNRVTPGVTGTGVNITKGCWIQITNVASNDNIAGFYSSLSANTRLSHLTTQYTTTTGSVTASGVEMDYTSGANASSYINNVSVSSSGITGITGLYAHGPCVTDFYVENFETALTDYGIKLTASSSGYVCNENIALRHIIVDQARVSGIQINGLNYVGDVSGRLGIMITDYYLASSAGSSIGLDLEGSSGVQATQGMISFDGSGAIGVKMAQGGAGPAK